MKRTATALLLLALAAATARADDWPAWRGPTGQGHSSEKGLPLKWSATENVKWKVPLPGPANSTPIVWKDKVFLTAANRAGSTRSLICFDRARGEQKWKVDVEYAAKEKNWQDYPYASASPTTDGERVVVSFGAAGLYCYDLAGKELWKRTDLGAWFHKFGNASSPVLYRDLCVLYRGPDEKGGANGLIAVDKKTGKTVWEKNEKTALQLQKDAGAWGTPVVVAIDGKDQFLYCPGFRLQSVDPKTGDDLWHCDGLMEYVYTSPLYSASHKIAVAMSGYGKSAFAVKVGGKGDITKDRLWHHPKNTQRVGSGTIVGDHIYVLEDGSAPKCYELESGKEVWRAKGRVGGRNWGSLVHADGRLYALTGDGSTVVFAASPKYELLATNRLAKGETTNSSPAISNGEIFLRTWQHLWCISEKK